MTGRPRSELRPTDITAIVDTREQLPFDLAPLKSVRGTLTTGDYSILGLERHIALERKSLQDLVGCVGRERERFDREIQRLRAFECKAIIVEASWSSVEMKQYRGDVHPNAVIGSVMGWIALGVPVLFCNTRECAQRFASRLLFVAARRRWHELQSFIPSLRVIGVSDEQHE